MPNVKFDDLSYVTTANVRTLLALSLAGGGSRKARWNLVGTAAPTTGDDDADGYSVGSIWWDITNARIYWCKDASTGAAVWEPVGNVHSSLFDANTILKADSDNTPVALTVAEQRIVGRITAGVITALTAAEVRTLINVADGATANPNAVEATSTFGTDNRILRADSTARLAQAGADATLDDSGNLVTAGYLRGDWLVETTASTSITWSDSYTGKLIICTAATTVTITCGDAVTANTHTTWLQAGNGQLQFAAGGSVTFLKLSGYNANCVGGGGLVVSVVTTAAAALGTTLGGDLEPV